jgi:hypothetical protein
MKLSRIIGLALMAMLLASMVVVGNASAAPVWEHCETGSIGTKWTGGQCVTASAGGTFVWSEVKGTEAAKGRATLTLVDTVLGTKVKVKCTGEQEGFVGPTKFGRVTGIKNISCVAGENCEVLVSNAKPLHLPWQTELAEEGGGVRNKITKASTEAPGWEVTCRVPVLGERTDVCTSETGSVGVKSVSTVGVATPLLVLGDFEANSGKAKCSVSGAETGEVREGTVGTLQANGNALRVKGA